MTKTKRLADIRKVVEMQAVDRALWRPTTEELDRPLHWKKPRNIFVCSMADLFHEDVLAEFIAAVFGVMAACPQHTFQVLTKRPDRAHEWFKWFHGWRDHKRFIHPSLAEHAGVLAGRNDRLYAAANQIVGRDTWPLPNVQLGISASNQKELDQAVPLLLQTPAAIRFVSLEPLLAVINIRYLLGRPLEFEGDPGERGPIQWIICGAESGPHRRECKTEWIEDIVDQCVEAGVPVFVKQAHEGGRVVKMPKIMGRVWDQRP